VHGEIKPLSIYFLMPYRVETISLLVALRKPFPLHEVFVIGGVDNSVLPERELNQAAVNLINFKRNGFLHYWAHTTLMPKNVSTRLSLHDTKFLACHRAKFRPFTAAAMAEAISERTFLLTENAGW
jgi:hypothetical protein